MSLIAGYSRTLNSRRGARDGLGVGLLLLEDAHWADEATLQFLLFLASGPLYLGAAWLAAAAAGRRGPATDAACRGRSRHGEEGVLDAGWGPPSEAFADFLHEHTGGLPLAVEESVRLMAARTELRRRGGRWMRRELAELAVALPVREAVLERVGRLDAAAAGRGTFTDDELAAIDRDAVESGINLWAASSAH